MVTDVALVVNPVSGRGRTARSVVDVALALRRQGLGVSVLIGRDTDDTLGMVRQAAQAGQPVVAMGGDGLVHLVLQAVAGTGTPLGIVATGTGNDIADTLGLPTKDPVASAAQVGDAVRRDRRSPVDAVRAVADDGSVAWQLGVACMGFDSRVNERANTMTWPKGPRRYDVAIVGELARFRPIDMVLTIDGERLDRRVMLVAAGNGRSYGGGMKICPDARTDDGLVDLTVLVEVSKARFVRMYPRVYRGTHVQADEVETYRGRVVRVEAPDTEPAVVVYSDGERFAPLPVEYTAVPGAVTLLR